MSGDYMSIHHQYVSRAHDMFERIWRRGHFERLIASIRQESRLISLLADRYHETDVPMIQRATHKPVRLERIVGTAGSLDFDRGFRPLRRECRARWIAVAIAMMADPTALPPIRVIEVGGDYYVVDGHHRVSVAKALKRLYIDAEVVSWQPLRSARLPMCRRTA